MSNDERNDGCVERHKTIEERLNNVDVRLNNHADRVKELEINNTKDIYSLNEAIKRLEATVTNLSQAVESLKYKPVKRFDNIIDTIIAVVLTAAVTYFLAKK